MGNSYSQPATDGEIWTGSDDAGCHHPLALFGFYGLFIAATEGVEKALVADIAPAELRGTAFGWFNLTAGLFLLPASVVFGWLYQTFFPSVAFGFSAGCSLTAALLLWSWAFRMKLRDAYQTAEGADH